MRLKSFMEIARVVFSPNEAERILFIARPGLVMVDNKLMKMITYEPKIPESAPKPKYLDNLVMIADNLANYFRILLKSNPKRYREELKRFEK